jgi:hypothetical protein
MSNASLPSGNPTVRHATTLTRASAEWSARPADERFASLAALHDAVTAHSKAAGVARVPFGSLHAKAVDGAVVLNGRTDTTAQLTHWAFGQLAQRAGAPASYLATLPAPLAADCINEGLAERASDSDAADDALILFDRAGDLTARAITTDRYTRIWNCDVTARLLRLESQGWQPAPAAFDGSRGLYAGNQDMFAFLVDNDRRIFETLPGGGLSRGFFVWNSEVGAAAFGICTFLYEYICGNHRVWGARDVSELRIRHTGAADDRAFAGLTAELRKYAESSASADEARIRAARSFRLGDDKDAVLDAVFALKIAGLSRKLAESAYTLAESRTEWYGDPRTAWGFTGGLTELARDLPNADARVALDRAAGKVLAVAF